MRTKKPIQKIAILGMGVVFFLTSLAPASSYGASGPGPNFSYAPKADNPLQINFTDQSTGDIAKWSWDFGDGDMPFITSHQRNPNGTLVNIAIDTIPIISKNIIVARSFEINDLNHNNIGDPILYYYDLISNSLVNTGGIAVGPKLSISNGLIAFVTTEYNMGIDLNGDGKLSNHIVMYYDLRENKIVSTGAETSDGHSPSISGDIIAFVTNEISIGKDLDGNGLINDWVVRYFDIKTGEVFNTKGEIFVNAHPFVSGNLIAFPTYEIDYGSDLNGDGDKLDMVLRYFNIVDGNLVNTRAEMVGGNLTILRNKIAFISRETSIGATGADLNGDGDKNDYVARYFDISSGKIINTGAEIKANHGKIPGIVAMSEHILAFTTLESSVGSAGADLNSDGDMQDDILRYYDFFSETIVNTGAEIFLNPFIDGKIIAFQTDERTVGRQGVDLNGDGDMGGLFPDRIARYFDVATGNLRNTAAEMSGADVPISGNVITFGVSENAIGPNGFDFNENGSVQDRFLRYFLINGVPATSNTSHIYANHGSYTVTLTVTDKNGVSNSITKVIEVREAVPSPLASFTATPTSAEAPLTVNFIDASTNGPVSWLWNFGDGQTSAQQNPSHTYTTPNTYTVSLTVANQSGSNTKTILNYISVTAPDTALPAVTITQPLDGEIVKDTITIKANASDDRGVSRVEFYLDNTLHSADNTFAYEYTWDTKTVIDGAYALKVKAYDDAGNSAEDHIVVKVNNAPPPPVNHSLVLTPIGNQTIDEGKELRFTISAFDPDNDPLTFLADNLPPGASFNPSTQTFSWRPNLNQAGTYPNIHFTVSDGKLTVFEDITITVNDVDRAPLSCITNPNQAVQSGDIVSLDGSCSSEPDSDVLVYQWSQSSGEGVFLNSPNQAIASFTAPEVSTDTELVFELTVSANGKSSTAIARVTVKPRALPSSLSIISPQEGESLTPGKRMTLLARAENIPNLRSVFFYINGQRHRANKRAQEYYYNWTIPYGYSQGYTIEAQAKDKDKDNALTNAPPVRVSTHQAPTIRITQPKEGDRLNPGSSLLISASIFLEDKPVVSEAGITKVEFYLNDGIRERKVKIDTSLAYSHNWHIPKKATGAYTIKAKAYSMQNLVDEDVIGVEVE